MNKGRTGGRRRRKVVVLAAGGSGGHVYPALAVAEQILVLDPDIKIYFIGSRHGLENNWVRDAGYSIYTVPVGRLQSGVRLSERLWTLLCLPFVFLKLFFFFLRKRPICVLGFGGFVSGPPVLMGVLLRRATYIWEPNVYPGLANRWLAPYVTQVFLLFKETAAHLQLKGFEILGYPLRSTFKKMEVAQKHKKFHVLVVGGSQGSQALNRAVFEAIKGGGEDFRECHFVHQTGGRHIEEMRSCYAELDFECVEPHAFLDNMPERYGWADLVVCRSGAGTLAELAACRKAAILVPLDRSADDHQRKNAQKMEGAGAAVVLDPRELSGNSLRELVLKLKNDPALRAELSMSISQFDSRGAALEIAKRVLGSTKGLA